MWLLYDPLRTTNLYNPLPPQGMAISHVTLPKNSARVALRLLLVAAPEMEGQSSNVPTKHAHAHLLRVPRFSFARVRQPACCAPPAVTSPSLYVKNDSANSMRIFSTSVLDL